MLKYRLNPAMAVRAYENTILVGNEYRLVSIKTGPATAPLLEVLEGLNEEPLSIEQLTDRYPRLNPEQLERFVERLRSLDLVNDAHDNRTVSPRNRVHDELDSFLTLYHSGSNIVVEDLTRLALTVWGHGRVAASLSEQLANVMLMTPLHVDVLPDHGDLSTMISETGDPSLDVLVLPELDETQVDSLNALLVLRSRPFLLLGHNENRLQVGPVCVPRQSACYNCVTLREYSNLENGVTRLAFNRAMRDPGIDPTLQPALPDAVSPLISLGATAIWQHVTGLHKSGRFVSLIGRRFELDTLTWQSSLHRIPKVPTCEVCGRGQSSNTNFAWTSLAGS